MEKSLIGVADWKDRRGSAWKARERVIAESLCDD